MTSLDFYKYMHNGRIEMRWDGDELIAWIGPYDLPSFCVMVSGVFSDGSIEAHLCSGGFVCVDLVPICEHYDINPEDILSKPEGV